ncbi:MAG: hypothetical protein PWR24_1532 [Desulfonauticus sp.]|jgi:DNA-binding transcriptional MocR family regulator|nr:MAG: Transcriptional regulator, GntR family with aminotransferase domain [Desulfonauticus sp. 38_4375]MDK2921975.1 hypothetical protein [Desulfonauticus sp.]
MGFKYTEVESTIISYLEKGLLKPGDRLPSLRKLSVTLGVSLSTVNQAYLNLEKQGLIEARPRSGYYVLSYPNHQLDYPKSPQTDFTPRTFKRKDLILEVLNVLGNEQLLPLGIIAPHPSLLPLKELNRAMRSVLQENRAEILNYEKVEGNFLLRKQISFEYLDIIPSLNPEDMLITNGAMEALSLAVRTLTRPGDNVLIQSPTYFCFLQFLENYGLRAIEIPSNPKRGINPKDVREALDRFEVKACIFSANFNNPDGSLTTEEQKKEIVALLAQKEVPLIEDDVSGDIYFGVHRPKAFKTYDQKGLVVYCSSFSKTLCPGYRVGWILPGRFYKKVYELKATTSVSSTTLCQLALAEYFKNNSYTKNLKKLNKLIELQMKNILVAINKYFPKGTKATSPQGGSVLWLELPLQIDSILFFQKALELGISIVPGNIFSTQDRFKNFIRISCNGLWNKEVENGIARLGQLAYELIN